MAAGITYDTFAFDCADPLRLGQFYAELLGGTVEAHEDGDWVEMRWDGPTISFQLAPDHRPPDWPNGQQQAHIDFDVVDIRAAHDRVVELGGTAVDPVEAPRPEFTRGYRVYTDPAGHPFCLCRPSPDAWG